MLNFAGVVYVHHTWLILMVNIGRYTIRGSDGFWNIMAGYSFNLRAFLNQMDLFLADLSRRLKVTV